MYDTILIPTDGSPLAARAAEHGLSIASQYDATVHVLYVVEPERARRSTAGDSQVAQAVDRESGQAVVAALASEAVAADVPVKTAMPRGRPDEEIAAYASEIDPDLVVVGCWGVDGHDPLGPVARALARTTGWPLLVYRE